MIKKNSCRRTSHAVSEASASKKFHRIGIAESCAPALVAWYRSSRRALPWRDATDPYAILVSEIMLQQTRVETVIPYYKRFLEAFPDVETLAAAPLEAVLVRWSGLGYYARARRLHQAAREIVARGAFPRTEADLRALPGIGPYTAGAIASIAFGEPVPAVDGNVERVIARLLDLDSDPRHGAARRRVREAAALLLDRKAPGDSNQAMMELGATLCRPSRPLCPACPLRDDCAGRSSGRAEELPVRAPRRRGVRERRVVAVVRRQGRFLLVRNPESSALLAGLWEFPWTPRSRRRAEWEASLGTAYGGMWRVGVRRGMARHGITFRALELEIHDAEVRFDGTVVAESAQRGEPGWLAPDEIAAVPTTSMVRKVLACLTGPASSSTERR
ncbi:MAG TPA: A/G-specific adenine glycosylase [Thermoanaerobaculia bacterium]|nr:A/G-specific adenine glycosylase [Thermoanaerobaculia bacterium]